MDLPTYARLAGTITVVLALVVLLGAARVRAPYSVPAMRLLGLGLLLGGLSHWVPRPPGPILGTVGAALALAAAVWQIRHRAGQVP